MADEYRWPQKVRRYGITCAFQRMLVVKYERQIDWSGGRIESPEALNQHLWEVMLPRLRELTSETSSRSHYCKTIHLERMLANPAPHIEEARGIRDRAGEEEARQFLLGHINQQKKAQFERWWSYLTQENAEYEKHPAFQYLLLRPVLESSTEKDTCAPVPLDAEALACLFERLGTGRVAPGQKLLSLLCEVMAFGDVPQEKRSGFGSDCHWVVIKSGEKNAASRVAALSRGSGWCVASERMASSYLAKSDFHLLVEKRRAVVALRLADNRAVEVQGKGNRDPGPWWPRILLYATVRALLIAHRDREAFVQVNSIRRELDEARGELRRLRSILRTQPSKVQFLDAGWVRSLAPAESGEGDPNRLVVMEAWRACARADPLSSGLFPDWMESDPSIARSVLNSWILAARHEPGAALYVPQRIVNHPEIREASRIGWLRMLENRPLAWSECPTHLHLDEEIRGALKRGWLNLLGVEPSKWSECPQHLRVDEEIREASRSGWLRLLGTNLLKWSECPPDFLGDDEVRQVLRSGWIEWLKRAPLKWEQCPPELREDEEVRRALRKGWMDLLESSPPSLSNCPPELQGDEEFRGALRSGWLKLLAVDPLKWSECPPELQGEEEFRGALRSGWLKLLGITSKKWTECPPDLRLDAGLRAVVIARLVGVFRLNRGDWNDCPAEFQQLQEVRDAFKMGWGNALERNPNLLDECPQEFRMDVEIRQAFKVGWIGVLRREPSKWETCPEHLQVDSAVREGLRKGWIELLARAPVKWEDCPADLQTDEAVRRSVIGGWIELVWRDPHKWEDCPRDLCEDGEVREALKNGWVDLLARNPRAWVRCPEDLLVNNEVADALKGAWIAVIMPDPSQWVDCPPHLLRDETVKNVLKDGWVRLVGSNPRNWARCPAFLQSDEALICLLRNAWVDLLHRGEGRLEECPDFLVADAEFAEARRIRRLESLLAQKHPSLEEIPKDIFLDFFLRKYPLPAYAGACFEALVAEPLATRAILGMWRHNSRIERAHCLDALAALRNTPWHFGTLPEGQQEHSLIREAAAEGWVDQISSSALFADFVPDALRSHSGINVALQAVASGVRKALLLQKAASRLALAEHCMKAVADSPGISDEKVRKLGLSKTEKKAWKRITSLRLRFWKNAVKKEWRLWETMPASLRQDEGILEVMRNGLGPLICQKASMWGELPECFRNDPCLQRVYRIATRPKSD